MNICILGGGNIGTVLLADIAAKKQHTVNLYTGRPECWEKTIRITDIENNEVIESEIDSISNDLKILEEADMILSTLPSNIFKEMSKDIISHIKKGTFLGFIPGSGGCEFCCKELLDKGCTLFGFQRVHSIARIHEYGKEVYVTSRKKEIQIGTIPSEKADVVCEMISNLLNMPCRALENYMCVTLTPSNPILHTSRLYVIFKEYQEGMIYDRNSLFYEEWTDESSRVMIGLDEELQRICDSYNELDLQEVKSLKEHYESNTVEKMTEKIRSIQAFKGIVSPMQKVEDGYMPDKKSRYFKEDFLFGLCIIKSFGKIANVRTPIIDEVLSWYEKFANVEFFVNGKFEGKDLQLANLPQNYGITTKKEVYEFYTKNNI
ncbi:NAD/NADP octopine/nopaline dehydrogenase family protein [Faecalimonas sp.]